MQLVAKSSRFFHQRIGILHRLFESFLNARHFLDIDQIRPRHFGSECDHRAIQEHELEHDGRGVAEHHISLRQQRQQIFIAFDKAKVLAAQIAILIHNRRIHLRMKRYNELPATTSGELADLLHQIRS